jgi:pyruvate formate lyase activating enzyme
MVKLGGLQKSTLIDFPGLVAATVFLSGCNFRCPFCYSPELVLPEKIKNHPEVSEKYFFEFLEERKGLLEGVVICGGEPTVQKGLPSFAKKIKDMGYSVKLDTNGSDPAMLERLIREKILDYVAMDIKAPREKYSSVVGCDMDVSKIERSVDLLKTDVVDYEFRTTAVPGILRKEDFISIGKWLSPAKAYFIQNFRPQKTLDPLFEKTPPCSDVFLQEIKEALAPLFGVCETRG